MIVSAQQKIVLASGNQGKIKEIQAILKDHPLVPQTQWQIPEADETGTTFVENAIIKARHAALHCHAPAIADDSGLVVDALDGAPGVISARYAGVGASDAENVQKLLAELKNIPEPQRTARFICVLVFMQHAKDPFPIIAQGVWEGRILFAPVGENGFGYDPVFWVEQYQCSSAQLPPELKNQLSHRAKALQNLMRALADFHIA
jgi:XTP/dITP diphosphohydrolase